MVKSSGLLIVLYWSFNLNLYYTTEPSLQFMLTWCALVL